MQKIRVILLLIFLHPSASIFAQDSMNITHIPHFGLNPGNLKMLVYRDEQKKDTGLKPLVIVLHGCGESVDEIARLTGWNKLASLNDFIVLYPHQRVLNNMSTCFNWFKKNMLLFPLSKVAKVDTSYSLHKAYILSCVTPIHWPPKST